MIRRISGAARRGSRLAVGAAILFALTTPGAPTAAASASQQMTVNLAADTGPVLHGASGALYGLSEDNVPGADLFDPLRVQTIAQGPPNAAQHPNGHSDEVAPEFFSAGGKWLLVYMQDYYSDWPYQDVGISSYLSTVNTIMASIDHSADASKYVFVPFNEPNNIWYTLYPDDSGFAAQMASFEQDWTEVYREIRADDPGALIAGPNTSYYDPTVMADFLSYAKANDVLPNIITWHELAPSSVDLFPSHYAGLVSLEKADGIPRLPVDIDEYADRYDQSDPGEMVQWISMFEDAKVYADMAFWDISDNYGDSAVQNDEPNGQWWLLDWYAAMTGHTVAVTAPQPNTVDTMQGLASLDTSKKQARIIIGDPSGGNDTVSITGISRATFGAEVHVSLQSTAWTGYDGSAYTPADLAEGNYPVVDGSISLPLGTVNPMAAYQIILTPASGMQAAPAVPQTQQYLAADAALTDATVYSQGSESNPNGYATAGGEDVGSIDEPDSRVQFNVTVPTTGRYFLSVYYGNQTGDISQQILSVNGGPWSFISYPPTLNWLFRSHLDMYVDLTAGSNTITFGVSDPSIGTAKGQVTMDDIQLTYAPGAVPGVTGPTTSYPAAYADLDGGATTAACTSTCAAPQVVAALRGSGAEFIVDAASDGYYALGLGISGRSGDPASFRLLVSGSQLKEATATANATSDVVYLHAGINPIEYVNDGSAPVLIDALQVTPDTAAASSAVTYAAAASGNVLSGAAVVQSNQYAYDGADVGYIGDGAANTLTFTGIQAPQAGTYRVMFSYADDETVITDNYNTDLVDRGFTVSTSAGTSETVYARNTYSWDQFDTVEATVQLAAGTNTITIGNPSSYAPNFDKIIVAPAYLS
jgi:hypothetical protein